MKLHLIHIFTFRSKCIDDWKGYISSLNIPCTQEFSFRKVLGSDIKIQAWSIASLPNDSFSVENAIIVDKSRRLVFYFLYHDFVHSAIYYLL